MSDVSSTTSGDPTVLAVVVESSRLAAALLDRDGVHLVRDRVTMPTRDVWRSLDRLIRRVVAAAPEGVARFDAVGVSCIGPIDDQAGAVSPPYVPGWTNFALREHLEELTEQPVTLATSGGASAEAERRFGEARGVTNFMSIVVDATVESACVIDGQRLAGAHGNAGAINHVTVDPDGLECWCGSRGCLEPYLSSIALEAEMNRPLRRANQSIIERGGIMFGRALATSCAAIDLDRVFITGSVIDAFGDQLLDIARRELQARSRLDNLSDLTLIEPVEHFAPLLRAASLVL